MAVSVFLPWYSEIDRFSGGDTFLGVTGPLYLAGLLVLLASSLSFSIVLMELLDRPLPKLSIKSAHLHVAASALSLFMLLLSTSVYHHAKFGVNITDKSTGIGMLLASIASGLVMFSGIRMAREGAVSFESEGHLEPLIDMYDRVDLEREPGDFDIDRNVTVGEAMDAQESKDDTEVWGPVQETLNGIETEETEKHNHLR